MPQKTDPKVEGMILALSREGLSSRKIVDRLNSQCIAISQKTVCNIINNVGKHRQLCTSQGVPSPVKLQPRTARIPAVVRKVDQMSSKENPPSQYEMGRRAKVSPRTVRRILADLGKTI